MVNNFKGRFWYKFIKNRFNIQIKNCSIYNIYQENKIQNEHFLLFLYLGIFKGDNPLNDDLYQDIKCLIYKIK